METSYEWDFPKGAKTVSTGIIANFSFARSWQGVYTPIISDPFVREIDGRTSFVVITQSHRGQMGGL